MTQDYKAMARIWLIEWFGEDGYSILHLASLTSQFEAIARGQWMPIETMPRDEAVLVGGGTIKYPIVCSRSGDEDEPLQLDYEGRCLDDVDGLPTHWQPLPLDPPAPSSEKP